MDGNKARTARVVVVAVLLLLLAAAPARGAVVNGNLPGGTGISVEIATPAEGALIASPSGDVSLTGSAAVGQAQPVANTALIYVLDVSGSTASLNGCGGNQNGDGRTNSVLDCEIAAAKALNQQAISAGTIGEVGVVVFGTGGAKADVGPAGGEQALTGPATDANGAGGPDVEQVLGSAFIDGGVRLFTFKNVGGATNFEAGVRNACSLVQQTTMANALVVFLSDGFAGAGGNALDDVPCSPKTATFQTFAIGSGSTCTNTGGGRGSLAQIAADTGGTCTQVSNVASLPSILPGLIASELTALTLSIDGGPAQDISSAATPSLPQAGPVSVNYGLTVPGLAPGVRQLCVTADGRDGGGTGSVTDCHSVTVADITLSPPAASNELGTAGQTHTVTAAVAAGPSGGVPGVAVSFSVTAGPNAGQSGSDTTDAGGEATFTYPATQGPAGLGSDTIQACFTDSQGTTSCASATKQWVDTTPPEVQCRATTNPPGANVPNAGANPTSGQNPDGFFVLTATDAVDPDPTLTLTDSASGATFGPFPSGTTIKLTQAPGATPNQKPGPGAIDWHITINGDASLTATDAGGNTSSAVACLVPPRPQ